MVTAISFEDGVKQVHSSLVSNRLTILVGAGLSMAAPSNLQSAAELARDVQRRYRSIFGLLDPSLTDNIEQQAEFFLENGEFETLFLRRLIDPHVFATNFNAGHAAIADLMITKSVSTVVSTNVDTMIESAGQHLYGHIESAVNKEMLDRLSDGASVLLKIHGCRQIDWSSTIWTPKQLEIPAIAHRINENAEWVSHRLPRKDLLVVGYWSDWDYLNAVLATVFESVVPVRFIVVNPLETAELEAKAPALFKLGESATHSFRHVKVCGCRFLDQLVCEFSKSFIRQVLYSGSQQYETGISPNIQPDWLEPPVQESKALWLMRRDLEGCKPDSPAVCREPQRNPALGLTLIQLRAGGAIVDGNYWRLAGKTIRVISAPGEFLNTLEEEYEREIPPISSPDIVIAVGAESNHLPANVARIHGKPSIARNGSSRWLTRVDALEVLQL